MTQPSFFWHDYETFGLNPRRDRPAQFAGQRTDFELNPIGEPLQLFCQPSDDYLPEPEAVLVTGITPQLAQAKGVAEHAFIAQIHEALAMPGSCGVGYNTLRYDDELTRHLLWRNLHPPYDREWRNDCGRWDLLDTVRACHAFRPDGINWPLREDGTPSFKLGDLTAANGIGHQSAHDALSDVQATIDLARLIKARQPRLFAHCLNLRKKPAVVDEIGPTDGRPFLHISGMFGAARGCLAVVVALGWHPSNRNELAVWDLAEDPALLADLNVDDIRRRMFTRAEDLPAGETRLPIKTIHINKSPVVVASLKVLSAERAAQLGIDLEQALDHARHLRLDVRLTEKLKGVFLREGQGTSTRDVDEALYDGFLGDGDAKQLTKLRGLTPEALAKAQCTFGDGRLEEVLFRYRARNWPQLLNEADRQRWQSHRHDRLRAGTPGFLNLAAFHGKIAELRNLHSADGTALQHLDQLEHYAASLAATLE